MKRWIWLILAALLVIGLVSGIIWKSIEIERCYDNGGIVVGPLMRDQQCVMPRTTSQSLPSSRS